MTDLLQEKLPSPLADNWLMTAAHLTSSPPSKPPACASPSHRSSTTLTSRTSTPSTARYLRDIAPALAQVCRDGRARVRLVGSPVGVNAEIVEEGGNGFLAACELAALRPTFIEPYQSIQFGKPGSR